MKVSAKIALIGFAIAAAIVNLNAQIELSGIYSDNMVVQRDAPIKIKGKAKSGTKVGVIFGEAKKQTVADKEGKWEIELDAQPANNTPVDMVIYDGVKPVKTIKNVLVGDVWVLGGQSNMEMTLSSDPIYKPVISRADIPTIRYFRMPGAALSEKPCEFTPKGAVWTVSTQKNAPAFSAVGYTFGERLAKDIDVPIGLIYTALGASCMQTWMPEEDLVKIPALSLILKKFNEEKKGYTKDTYKKKLAEYEAAYAKHKKDVEEAKKNKKAAPIFSMPRPMENTPWPAYSTPCYLYNAKIAPLAGLPIKGILWYQGESAFDANYPECFEEKFRAIVDIWRRNFNNPELPFLCVQIASYDGRKNWPEVRLLQHKVASSVPNMAIATAIDLGEKNNIHPKFKEELGRRLEQLALKKVYSKDDIVAESPTLQSVKYGRNNTKVHFKFDGKKLECRGEPRGFEILVNDKWVKPNINFVNNTVVLKTETGERIDGVRYLWKIWAQPDVCIYGENNLPALPFEHKRKK